MPKALGAYNVLKNEKQTNSL